MRGIPFVITCWVVSHEILIFKQDGEITHDNVTKLSILLLWWRKSLFGHSLIADKIILILREQRGCSGEQGLIIVVVFVVVVVAVIVIVVVAPSHCSFGQLLPLGGIRQIWAWHRHHHHFSLVVVAVADARLIVVGQFQNRNWIFKIGIWFLFIKGCWVMPLLSSLSSPLWFPPLNSGGGGANSSRKGFQVSGFKINPEDETWWEEWCGHLQLQV